MENQHRKISGYRELDQVEIDLMNEVKALGPIIEEVLNKIDLHLINQRNEVQNGKYQKQGLRMINATPERFLETAKTDIQIGLMAATRAVAQPEFF